MSIPYFFLDVNDLGYGGVLLWVLGLLGVFVAIGYILWLWNRFDKVDGKWKLDFHHIIFPNQKTCEAGEMPLKENDN